MKSSLSELQNNDFPSLWASNAGELSLVSGNQKSTAAATESAECCNCCSGSCQIWCSPETTKPKESSGRI